MSIILVLASAGFLLALGFLAAFWWAASSGQFDDTYTPSVRVLHDEPAPANSKPVETESSDSASASDPS
ncbi:MAG: cbb3-type cytochrome oxidase assembly protein CcoS [Bacteroidales bacterium]